MPSSTTAHIPEIREAAEKLLDANPELEIEYSESEEGVVWLTPRHFENIQDQEERERVSEAFLRHPDVFLDVLKHLLKERTEEHLNDLLVRGWGSLRMASLPRHLVRHRGGLISVAGIVNKVSGQEAFALSGVVYKCCEPDGTCFSIRKVADPDIQYLPKVTRAEVIDALASKYRTEEEMKRSVCWDLQVWTPSLEESDYTGILKFELQDMYEKLPFGTVPKSVKAYLLANSALDMITPGKRAVFYGVIKPLMIRSRSEWVLRFKVLGWDSVDDSEASALIENRELGERLAQIAKQEQELWLWKLQASFSYPVWGLWKVKESLLLSIVRGTPIGNKDAAIRDRIHVLIVSDPGMGKGELAKWVQKVYPRTILTVGASSTGVGVTVAVVYDKETGRWTVEPGAIPLAGDGIVIIDEFDKMKGDDVRYLYDVMERGAIAINKAGISMTIRAPATIIGLANPKYSRYDPRKSLAENLQKFDTAIMSRFSIFWVLKATPGPSASEEEWNEWLEYEEEKSLWISRRYVVRPPLSPEELSAFLMWARRQSPSLTPEADEILHKFYLAMKRKMMEIERETGVPSPIAITARQREDLIRIATAYAKLTASREATAKHALMAVALLQESLKSVYFDPLSGEIDVGGLIATPLNKELAREMYVQAIAEYMTELYESEGRNRFEIEDLVSYGIQKVPQIQEYYSREELLRKTGNWVKAYLEDREGVVSYTGSAVKILAL